MDEKNRGKKSAGTNPGAAVDYDDARGEDRYVGGGIKGGQNWSSEGYGANQSYSAGPNTAAGTPHGAAADAGSYDTARALSQRDYAVSPEDLDVTDYDLQGGYGKPPDNKPG
jgi:hypothetical protein